MHIITTDMPEKSVLYKQAKTVQFPLSKEIIERIEQMRTFYKTFDDKAGFAAPQVGLSDRIILVERELYDGKKSKEPTILINPCWEPLDDTQSVDIEGCLSVPNKSGIVMRHLNIKLSAELYIPKTQKTKHVSHEYRRVFSSILWQHEIDHLNGEIYADKAEIILKTEEMDLILEHLFHTNCLLDNADIFDMGAFALKLAREYKLQTKPLAAFLKRN